jgi:hypothetical protein
MAVAFEEPVARDQCDRQIVVLVDIRIAEAAAVTDHCVVEQIAAVSVGGRLQLLDVVGKEANQILVDLGDLFDEFGGIAMVRERVVSVGLSLWIRACKLDAACPKSLIPAGHCLPASQRIARLRLARNKS